MRGISYQKVYTIEVTFSHTEIEEALILLAWERLEQSEQGKAGLPFSKEAFRAAASAKLHHDSRGGADYHDGRVMVSIKGRE